VQAIAYTELMGDHAIQSLSYRDLFFYDNGILGLLPAGAKSSVKQPFLNPCKTQILCHFAHFSHTPKKTTSLTTPSRADLYSNR